MTWAEIKFFCSSLSPATMGGIIDAESGSPTELAMYARVINNRIAGSPHKFSWMLSTYTLTLTGASEYNLRSLIPGFGRVRVIVSDNNLASYAKDIDLYRRNYGSAVFTIQNSVLKFDTPPTSGTLVIPFYTRYLVKDAGGNLKQDFTDSDDVSVVPDEHINLLLEGMYEFFYRKEGKAQFTKTFVLWDGRVVNIDPYSFYYQQAILDDREITNPMFDFRFEP